MILQQWGLQSNSKVNTHSLLSPSAIMLEVEEALELTKLKETLTQT